MSDGIDVYPSTDGKIWVVLSTVASATVPIPVANAIEVSGPAGSSFAFGANSAVIPSSSVSSLYSATAQTSVTINAPVPGQTWTVSGLPITGILLGMATSGSNAVTVASSSNAAAYSTDGGQTWTASTLPSSTTWRYAAMSGSNAVAIASSSNAAAYSTNGGQTWTASTLPSSTTWTSVAMSGSNAVAIAADAPGTFAYSTDGGQTWTASTLPSVLPSGATWTSVAMSGSNAVAISTIGIVAHSVNGGQTWAAVSSIQDALPSKANSPSWQNIAISSLGVIAIPYENGSNPSNIVAHSTIGLSAIFSISPISPTVY